MLCCRAPRRRDPDHTSLVLSGRPVFAPVLLSSALRAAESNCLRCPASRPNARGRRHGRWRHTVHQPALQLHGRPRLRRAVPGPALRRPHARGREHHPTTKSATASPTPTRSASASPTPSAGKGCTASYSTVNSWEGGFQGKVAVKAGSSAITGWAVKWSLGSGQSISQVWNGKLTTSGSNASVVNESYNGAVAAGASTTFGLLGTGIATTPTLTCTSA
ncbi:cellulose binding domain-containing protein [Dactylosporangium sp. NPDC049742]|uniref:cellulose binding domain-containing protein n=1 Tax=Dactylosporangium sp. NPDC049742 TaxID=3154737 RepID=UPI00341A0FDB